jgi:hypothetical protein
MGRSPPDTNKTSIRDECVIHIGESCIAIFVEVTLPYTFSMKTTHMKMFSELKVAENLV